MSTVQLQPLCVTIPQAAEALGISDRTIFSLISEGQLQSINIGSARRIPMGELTRLAKEGADLPTVAERQSKAKQVAA